MSYTMKPFRAWVQKALPLVYDDSLSYYELLGKVIAYLNTMATNVNNIGDYFDNLDVSEEIDNKLDEMAESGALSAVIADAVAPSFVTSTSDMTDEEKTYVLTTNLHVYYYNGTEFVDTGIAYGLGLDTLKISTSIWSLSNTYNTYRTNTVYLVGHGETVSSSFPSDASIGETSYGIFVDIAPNISTIQECKFFVDDAHIWKKTIYSEGTSGTTSEWVAIG